GDDARRVIADLNRLPPESRLTTNLVLVHAVIGELDEAFALAAEAEWDLTSLVDVRTNPFLRGFREDPRYPGFLSRLGLEP
ncbi:MAG TPA: hypothetical protein VMK53_05890, partial [Gemmatimonadales bacterium]|nr:hypothetical protein [Gemmatimonadales bacterium]